MSPQYQPHGRAPLWSSLGSNTLQSSTSLFETQPGKSSNERPWVPPPHHHCQFKVCHRCYRGAAEKSWLSLDGIVNGDISPTAATGYAFSYMKERPICDVSVVNSLGYRAVPLVSLSDHDRQDGPFISRYDKPLTYYTTAPPTPPPHAPLTLLPDRQCHPDRPL